MPAPLDDDDLLLPPLLVPHPPSNVLRENRLLCWTTTLLPSGDALAPSVSAVLLPPHIMGDEGVP